MLLNSVGIKPLLHPQHLLQTLLLLLLYRIWRTYWWHHRQEAWCALALPRLLSHPPGSESALSIGHQPKNRHGVDEHARRIELRARSKLRSGVIKRVLVVPDDTGTYMGEAIRVT